jgi:hypothetical protein
LSFYASKVAGTISVSYQGWDVSKVVLEGQVFEVSWGPQGVEGRIGGIFEVRPGALTDAGQIRRRPEGVSGRSTLC